MKRFLNVNTLIVLVLAFLVILVPLGQDWYKTYQNDQVVVNSLEYSVIRAIEEVDPSIYVWLVREQNDMISVWVTWVPGMEDAGMLEKKAALMAFLEAIVAPLYQAYPDVAYYYIVTCIPIEANVIETEGHVLEGDQIWSFTPQAAEAIAAGITYDELEILGTNKLLDLVPAYMFGGARSNVVTERPNEHVRPW